MNYLKLLFVLITILFVSGCGGSKLTNRSIDETNIAYKTSLSLIKSYANQYSEKIPTIDDYNNLGIYEVTKDNIDDINLLIQHIPASKIENEIALQKAVIDYLKSKNIIMSYLLDKENAKKPTTLDYYNIGIFHIDNIDYNKIKQKIKGYSTINSIALQDIYDIFKETPTSNKIPTATSQTVTVNEDTHKTITLTGVDEDNDSLTYQITKLPRHGYITGTVPNLIYFPNENFNGIDSIKFKVNDGKNNSDEATINITVNSINDAPTADAGADKSILENQSTTLQCQGSDIDGTIKSYRWLDGTTELSTSQNYTTPTTLKIGKHTYTCEVTDNEGATASDNVDITVKFSNTNKAPTADAGDDKNIIVGKPKTIVGYAIDIDGLIVKYEWRDGDKILAESPSFVYTASKEGNVTLVLTVTDDQGATSSDTVTITSKIESINSDNLLEGKNPNVDGSEGFLNVGDESAPHRYISDETHTDDGSGSIKLVEHWYYHPIKTSTFKLEKDKLYTFGAYMKAVGDDKGQNLMFKISKKSDYKVNLELNYNVSKAGEWEEVAIPYRAKESGEYLISVFTYRYAITTDGKSAKEDSSNIDRNASILLDDFFVYETRENEGIKTNEKITAKMPFESSIVKIDEQGNWQIKENGEWKDFFPKFVFRDFTDIAESSKKYSSYGFTGFANIPSLSQMQTAVENGMKYNSIQVNRFTDSTKKAIADILQDIADEKLPATSLIAYTFDNENFSNYDLKKIVSDWINSHDSSNPITSKRDRPIYMLNGMAEGLARNYKNSKDKDYMDVTGTYISQNGNNPIGDIKPVNTLSMLQKQHKQIAPVSIMQLQCYYGNSFIPALYKGLADGAKGLSFWRAGGGDPVKFGCLEKFEDNVFAPAIKETFANIDKMLPIIKEPLGTTWSATVGEPLKIAIGTRDHDGKHYIILANFGNKDTYVDVYLENLDATIVRDYFTKEKLTEIRNNTYFNIPIGHHNKGYLVLELE